jgi:allantoin racemase
MQTDKGKGDIMMKIMVINPNSSIDMTHHIRKILEAVKRAETELLITCPSKGPVAIESAYDETLAAFYSMELVKKANSEKYDALVIACFSDPGLVAMKEMSDILVVGIQEASLHAAAMLGHKFTIITSTKKRIPSKYNDVWRNKLLFNLASVRELGMTVTETDKKPDLAQERILEVARKAVEKDGAEVIILGCAGMAGYAEKAARELNIVVIDPTVIAFKYAEAMVEAGIKQSKRAIYAYPSKKEYKV